MRAIWFLLLISVINISSLYAISKEAFLKLSHEERYSYVIVVGFPPNYAIPKKAFDKLSIEIRRTIMQETARERAHYAIHNLGKKNREIDLARLYDLKIWHETRIDKEGLVDYLELCGIYYSYGNHIKAAPYCRMHYLEWKKAMAGQPSLWRDPNGGGDSAADGFYDVIGIFEASKRYKEAEWFYADYHKTYWLHLAESYPKDIRQKFLDSIEIYPEFMKAWKRVRELAKTEKPKPLDPAVQNHEWFYSDKQGEVLKALEYYYTNKVNFMLEKAIKHKDPVVVTKVKEYLEKLQAQPPGQVSVPEKQMSE